MRSALAAVALLAAACAAGGCRGTALEGRERPDPWLMRTVLDGHPRSLVACLEPDLWIAVDTERGLIRRVWSQGVHWSGAVHDSLHGPQPASRGPAYLAWPEGSEPGGWSDGTGAELEPVWVGHRLRGRGARRQASLHWHVLRGDRAPVEVALTPRAEHLGNRLLLELDFDVRGLEPGDRLSIPLPPGPVPPLALEPTGGLTVAADHVELGPEGGRLRLTFAAFDASAAAPAVASDSDSDPDPDHRP